MTHDTTRGAQAVEGRVEKALAILNQPSGSVDSCQCERCRNTIARTGVQTCEGCGYTGLFTAIACACYDYSCPGSGTNGTGCPHEALTCPVCNDGEVDPWEIIVALRDALNAATSGADEEDR